MACRNMEKANEAMEEIKKECSDMQNLGTLKTIQFDLGSLESVRKCASILLQEEPFIHLLINNAGIMMCPESKTADGFEMQFGTNHLGHFLFTLLLLPTLIKSKPSRIVIVSSLAHTLGKIKFDDLNWEKRSYSSIGAYSQSKLANVLFCKELANRLKEIDINDVTIYALHPGVIKTDLVRHVDDSFFKGGRFLYDSIMGKMIKTPLQGAQTTIYCAVDEEAGKETGLYYAECKTACSSSSSKNMVDAKRLWEDSLKLVGLNDYDLSKFDSPKY